MKKTERHKLAEQNFVFPDQDSNLYCDVCKQHSAHALCESQARVKTCMIIGVKPSRDALPKYQCPILGALITRHYSPMFRTFLARYECPLSGTHKLRNEFTLTDGQPQLVTCVRPWGT